MSTDEKLLICRQLDEAEKRADKAEAEIEMLRAANEAAVNQEQVSRAEANRQRERADKAEKALRLQWVHCDAVLSDGSTCNCPMQDHGTGIGYVCPLCAQRERADKAEQQLAKLKSGEESAKLVKVDSAHLLGANECGRREASLLIQRINGAFNEQKQQLAKLKSGEELTKVAAELYQTQQQLAKVNGWREGLRQRLRDRNDQLVVVQDLAFQYKQQLAQAQAQVDSLRGAVETAVLLIGTANKGAFTNGNTDQSGTIDEGEVLSGRLYEELKALLKSSPCGSDFVPRAELDKAQAQVTSLREALNGHTVMRVYEKHLQQSPFYKQLDGTPLKTDCVAIAWVAVKEILDSISTSCGSGMIPVTELDVVIEFVREVHEWCVADNPCDVDADKAEEILTRLQSLRAKGTK